VIGNRPVVAFDTSVHNRMHRDGAASDDFFAALKVGYFVRIAGLSIEELLATPDASKRAEVVAFASRLQAGPSDCLMPQNEMLRRLIAAYEDNPTGFDWKRVNVTAPEYGREISRGELIADDKLAADQRDHLMDAKKEFEQPWSNLRPKLEEIIERHGESAPTAFDEILPMVEAEGGLVSGIGQGLYGRVATGDTSEATVRDFMAKCPPFRAVVYSFILVWFDRSLADRHKREKYTAGRVDLFMAIYLPYCDQFISAEGNGMQQKCLREIARAAKLETQVRSYDEFCNSLLVTV
jgi:hypothetical protein